MLLAVAAQVALDLFEATWEELVGTPSRQSAEEEAPVRRRPSTRSYQIGRMWSSEMLSLLSSLWLQGSFCLSCKS